MPLNKEAAIRYMIIDRCLTDRHKPYPTMDDLIESCNAKLGKNFAISTLQKDIKSMKEDEALGYLAPIKFSKSRNGYYYSDPAYSIKNVPLNDDEIEAMEFAAGILEQYRGARISDNFNIAVEKVLTSLKIQRLQHDDANDFIIQPEISPYLKGYEQIDVLVHCIKERKPVSFDHFSYQELRTASCEVHPYLLKEHRNRWYLVGYSETHKDIRLFGLDRMENIAHLNKKFYKVKNFDPRTHFKYAIGVFVKKADEIAHIKLWFNNKVANYIKSQPIHETQEIEKEEKDGAIVVSIQVYRSLELIQLLLSYGADVYVISPTWLRKELETEYRKALALVERGVRK